MVSKKLATTPYEMVVIGGSAGSLNALKDILPGIDEDFPLPIVIVTHRSSNEYPPSAKASVVQQFANLPVLEPDDKQAILPSTIYIAPGNYHLMFDQDTFVLSQDPPELFSRPSINVSFESAADEYGSRLIAILLTGANKDGADGISVIKQKGGFCMVQDPKDAESPVMPRSAINLNPGIDEILPATSISICLNNVILGKTDI